MELENQVVSLEYAKQLKELGFEQESLFYFMRAGNDWLLCFKHNMGYQMTNGMVIRKEVFESNEHYSAYTVAELGEMLPKTLTNGYKIETMYKFKKGERIWLHSLFDNDGKEYGCSYNGKNDKYWYAELADTEADCRAKMLIYLKENNLI